MINARTLCIRPENSYMKGELHYEISDWKKWQFTTGNLRERSHKVIS